MTEDAKEMFTMITKPKGKEASAVQLSQDIWKVEDELDLLYSPAKNAYESYADPGEAGILLKIDGTLVLSYPSAKECHEKFKDIKERLAKSTVLSTIKYEELELGKYKISKKMQGKLEDVAPKELTAFLRGKEQEICYDPKKISYEFVDRKIQRNFIKIVFDKVMDEEKLLLDVTVESNKVEYGKETIKKIQSLIGK